MLRHKVQTSSEESDSAQPTQELSCEKLSTKFFVYKASRDVNAFE